MSNSKLVSYTKKSPNHSGKRKHPISRITIHHMGGHITVEQCGSIFAKASRKASSNYGIDYNAKVALYVDESNRAWTSSSADNDNRAVTIETANSKVGGNWPVSDKTMKKLIELCVDICQRNGKKKLIWKSNKSNALSYKLKSGEMLLTIHQWFSATDCPGPYLKGKMSYIAEEVNKKLSGSDKKEEKKTTAAKKTTDKKEEKTTKYKVCAKRGMNVRKEASTSSKILTAISYGTTFVATKEKKSGSSTWVYSATLKGWICVKDSKQTYLKKV